MFFILSKDQPTMIMASLPLSIIFYMQASYLAFKIFCSVQLSFRTLQVLFRKRFLISRSSILYGLCFMVSSILLLRSFHIYYRFLWSSTWAPVEMYTSTNLSKTEHLAMSSLKNLIEKDLSFESILKTSGTSRSLSQIMISSWKLIVRRTRSALVE